MNTGDMVTAQYRYFSSIFVHRITHLELDCAMRTQVEVKTTPQTPNPDLLQKAADFVHAFILGVQ